MAFESAPRPESREVVPPKGNGLLHFPQPRSFGPLSWRTVRMASLVILVLILGGAFLEMFFWRPVREPRALPSRAETAPS